MSKAAKPKPPPFTMVPRSLLRRMDELSESALRVALVVADETYGWQRRRAKISLRQFRQATGLSEQGVINGIHETLKERIVKRTPVDKANPRAGFLYRLPHVVEKSHIERNKVLRNGAQKSEIQSEIQWRRGESEHIPTDADELRIAQRNVARAARRYGSRSSLR